ncbi:MAG TPA: VOC family protein [Gaiellaceae bacterium]|nr:VOC family protein [Gaiellaceae bacterium]
MFDHVTIRASDLAASRRFYDLVFETLEFPGTPFADDHFLEWYDFSVARADAEHPVTRGLHVGFASPSRDHVDAFWRNLTAAGCRDDGAPGPRPQYRDDYYGAFVVDPDGNSAEAVHHGILRGDGGVIDHLWIRVADVAASKRFYETIAPVTGILLRVDEPERAAFRGSHGSCSFVAGDARTEHAHLAFAVPDNTAVAEFHRAATAAGYRDNGGPGERPEYHPGYYGAYVLDPDGHNVEAVCHNRPG